MIDPEAMAEFMAEDENSAVECMQFYSHSTSPQTLSKANCSGMDGSRIKKSTCVGCPIQTECLMVAVDSFMSFWSLSYIHGGYNPTEIEAAIRAHLKGDKSDLLPESIATFVDRKLISRNYEIF